MMQNLCVFNLLIDIHFYLTIFLSVSSFSSKIKQNLIFDQEEMLCKYKNIINIKSVSYIILNKK